jgi:hypothetical protein
VNLDALRGDIIEHLEGQGFLVFEGFCRNPEARPVAYWDTGRRPEFQRFLDTARQAGVKIVVFNHLEFASGMAEDALDRLEQCEMPSDDRRAIERKLREILPYHGFTCSIELSYDCENRTYIYEVQADWYSDFLHTLDQIESLSPEGEEPEDDESMGGYFSRN